MKYKGLVAIMAGLLAAPLGASADVVMTFTPDPPDMNGLDHYYAYKWGIDVPLGPGEYVAGAKLTFYNIRNWNDEANILYNHLLDWAKLGLNQVYDNQGGGDYFETGYGGLHAHLVTYVNLPETPEDLVYTFTSDDVAVLNSYLADGRCGVGVDPDCHYYNDGVELSLTIVPEPASMVLLAAGIIGLARRR